MRRRVYELASAEDRRWRTLEQHLEGHPQFPAEFQELIVELGEFIEVRATESDLQGDAGVVTVHGAVPNANHAELRDLLYGEGAAARPRGWRSAAPSCAAAARPARCR